MQSGNPINKQEKVMQAIMWAEQSQRKGRERQPCIPIQSIAPIFDVVVVVVVLLMLLLYCCCQQHGHSSLFYVPSPFLSCLFLQHAHTHTHTYKRTQGEILHLHISFSLSSTSHPCSFFRSKMSKEMEGDKKRLIISSLNPTPCYGPGTSH